MRQYWLMKSEPSVFSIADLAKVKVQFWDGVRNYQVRNMFRDNMKAGDWAIFYHSSCDLVGAAGEMEIMDPLVIDETQFKKAHRYFDPKSNKDNPRWLSPKVKFKKQFKSTVPLAKIKSSNKFTDSRLLQKGNRLSVVHLTKEQYQELVLLGKDKI